MRRAFLACCVSFLLAYVPVTPAAPPIAVGKATIKGSAEINGSAAPGQFTLFSGDRIATRSNTAAQLALPGGNEVLLPSRSEATVTQVAKTFHVRLNHGSLAVLSKASNPVVIEASGARIRPAAGVAAVLEVAVNGNEIRVISRRGAATIEAANRTVKVPSGKELVASMAPPPPPQESESGLSSMDKATLVVATAAGLTGLALGIDALTRPNPSNCKVISSSTISCP